VVSDLRRVRDLDRPPDAIDWIWADTPSFYGGQVAYDIETIDACGEVGEQPTQVAFATGGQVLVGRWPVEVTLPVPTNLISHFGWDFDDHKTGIQSTRDTAALAYLDDENQPLGLESLCVKYLGKKGWKEDRDGAALGSDELAEYNARDAGNTLELHDCLVRRLGSRIKSADDILLPARLALNECSRAGLSIDLGAVLTARAHFADNIMETRVRCRALANPDLNPGSYPQVALVLRGRGHDLPKTDHNNDATDKAILRELHDEFADAVIAYREAVKMDSTYGRPYEKAARSDDGRMHNRYTIIRTVTGRTSAQDENVQNLPRALRGFLKDIAIADYAGIEFRLAAWLADERVILDRYAADRHWDPHAFFASRLFAVLEENVSPDQRQIGKTGNFSQLFLGTPETLVEYGKRIGVDIAPDPARLVNRMFPKIYPGFAQWWANVLANVKDFGFVESPTGRRRHFGEWKHFSGVDKLDVWRQAVNHGPQSLTADLALLGLACCHRAHLPICGFFHDAIAFDLAGGWQLDAEAVRRCMVEEPLAILRQQFGVDITIPIEIDIKSQ
jgi:DNA polymerase-1